MNLTKTTFAISLFLISIIGKAQNTFLLNVEDNWSKTEYYCIANKEFRILAYGAHADNPESDNWIYSPGGSIKINNGSVPYPGIQDNALIGRIGTSGEPFYIGLGGKFNSSVAGDLYVMVNDGQISNNVGYIILKIFDQPLSIYLYNVTSSWSDTEIELSKDQEYFIYASGSHADNPESDNWIMSPCGSNNINNGSVPMPGIQDNALIGRIGEGDPFYIGEGGKFIPAENGKLQVMVNDGNLSNNVGYIIIQVFGDNIVDVLSELPFSDCFESGNFRSQSWDVTGSAEISSSSPQEGTYCVKGTGSYVIEKTFEPITEELTKVEFQMKASQTGKVCVGFKVYDNNDNFSASVYFNHTGKIGAHNGTSGFEEFLSYSVDTWYKVKVILDNTTKTFDIYIDDILLADDYDFYSNSFTSPARFFWGSGETNGTGWIDCVDISLSSIDIKKMIGYYPFNGNANDESGSNINGVVDGAILTTDRFGNENSAYYFDGNDKISLGDNFDIESEITFCAWINIDAENLTQFNGIIEKYALSVGSDSEKSYVFRIDQAYPSSYFYKGADSNLEKIALKAEQSITGNAWYFVATTYDKGDVSIYLDGELIAQQKTSITPINNSGGATIIGNNLGNENPMHGKIDEVRIYNYALTASEISNLYSSITSKKLNAKINSNIEIYPIPFKQELKIKFHAKTSGSIEFVDMSGKKQLKREIDNKQSISVNTSELISGIYIVKTITNKGTFFSRVVKD